MIRLAIAEDEALFRKQLREYLSRYEKESGQELSVSVFSDGSELLSSYRGQYDIVLLDIQMRDLDGMSTAKKIRETDEATLIAFITNTPQYAIEGYSVGALDYVLKPLSYYAFSQCMERLARRIRKHDKTYLAVNHPEGVRKIDADELQYVEVHGHTLIYHTPSGDISAPGAMKDVEEAVKDKPFFRCNKGDLVNLAYVDGIRNGDAVISDRIIQVSRSKKKAFLEALNRHINEVRA